MNSHNLLAGGGGSVVLSSQQLDEVGKLAAAMSRAWMAQFAREITEKLATTSSGGQSAATVKQQSSSSGEAIGSVLSVGDLASEAAVDASVTATPAPSSNASCKKAAEVSGDGDEAAGEELDEEDEEEDLSRAFAKQQQLRGSGTDQNVPSPPLQQQQRRRSSSKAHRGEGEQQQQQRLYVGVGELNVLRASLSFVLTRHVVRSEGRHQELLAVEAQREEEEEAARRVRSVRRLQDLITEAKAAKEERLATRGNTPNDDEEGVSREKELVVLPLPPPPLAVSVVDENSITHANKIHFVTEAESSSHLSSLHGPAPPPSLKRVSMMDADSGGRLSPGAATGTGTESSIGSPTSATGGGQGEGDNRRNDGDGGGGSTFFQRYYRAVAEIEAECKQQKELRMRVRREEEEGRPLGSGHGDEEGEQRHQEEEEDNDDDGIVDEVNVTAAMRSPNFRKYVSLVDCFHHLFKDEMADPEGGGGAVGASFTVAPSFSSSKDFTSEGRRTVFAGSSVESACDEMGSEERCALFEKMLLVADALTEQLRYFEESSVPLSASHRLSPAARAVLTILKQQRCGADNRHRHRRHRRSTAVEEAAEESKEAAKEMAVAQGLSGPELFAIGLLRVDEWLQMLDVRNHETEACRSAVKKRVASRFYTSQIDKTVQWLLEIVFEQSGHVAWAPLLRRRCAEEGLSMAATEEWVFFLTAYLTPRALKTECFLPLVLLSKERGLTLEGALRADTARLASVLTPMQAEILQGFLARHALSVRRDEEEEERKEAEEALRRVTTKRDIERLKSAVAVKPRPPAQQQQKRHFAHPPAAKKPNLGNVSAYEAMKRNLVGGSQQSGGSSSGAEDAAAAADLAEIDLLSTLFGFKTCWHVAAFRDFISRVVFPNMIAAAQEEVARILFYAVLTPPTGHQQKALLSGKVKAALSFSRRLGSWANSLRLVREGRSGRQERDEGVKYVTLVRDRFSDTATMAWRSARLVSSMLHHGLLNRWRIELLAFLNAVTELQHHRRGGGGGREEGSYYKLALAVQPILFGRAAVGVRLKRTEAANEGGGVSWLWEGAVAATTTQERDKKAMESLLPLEKERTGESLVVLAHRLIRRVFPDAPLCLIKLLRYTLLLGATPSSPSSGEVTFVEQLQQLRLFAEAIQRLEGCSVAKAQREIFNLWVKDLWRQQQHYPTSVSQSQAEELCSTPAVVHELIAMICLLEVNITSRSPSSSTTVGGPGDCPLPTYAERGISFEELVTMLSSFSIKYYKAIVEETIEEEQQEEKKVEIKEETQVVVQANKEKACRELAWLLTSCASQVSPPSPLPPQGSDMSKLPLSPPPPRYSVRPQLQSLLQLLRGSISDKSLAAVASAPSKIAVSANNEGGSTPKEEEEEEEEEKEKGKGKKVLRTVVSLTPSRPEQRSSLGAAATRYPFYATQQAADSERKQQQQQQGEGEGNVAVAERQRQQPQQHLEQEALLLRVAEADREAWATAVLNRENKEAPAAITSKSSTTVAICGNCSGDGGHVLEIARQKVSAYDTAATLRYKAAEGEQRAVAAEGVDDEARVRSELQLASARGVGLIGTGDISGAAYTNALLFYEFEAHPRLKNGRMATSAFEQLVASHAVSQSDPALLADVREIIKRDELKYAEKIQLAKQKKKSQAKEGAPTGKEEGNEDGDVKYGIVRMVQGDSEEKDTGVSFEAFCDVMLRFAKA